MKNAGLGLKLEEMKLLPGMLSDGGGDSDDDDDVNDSDDDDE